MISDKKYNIIYADPPWTFVGWAKETKEGKKRGDKSPSNHYKVQSMEWIKKLPVQEISENNCILFLWVTFPVLKEAFSVIDSWGFNYSTCGFVWVKTNKNFAVNQTSFLPEDSFNTFTGLGYWTRANAEICLIAKKGTIERQSRSVHQLVYDPIREHSHKPDCVRDRIVELCGDLPRIELFARQSVKGWDNWGNQVDKFSKQS